MNNPLSHRAVLLRAMGMTLVVLIIAGAIGGFVGHQLGTNVTSIAIALLVGVICGAVGGNLIAMWTLDHWE